jgi:phosphoglucosamine mutase
MRARVGSYPFTHETLPVLGRALARWGQEKYGPGCSFLIAGDTRYSRSWIHATLTSGLLRYPVTVYNAHIIPTPALFHIMKDEPTISCGIMISASHNPAEDNGIKLIDSLTGKLSLEDEERISYLINHPDSISNYDALGEEIHFAPALQLYQDRLINLFPRDLLNNKTIVLDCANGATSYVVERVFMTLGARTVIINHTPDGYNINKNCGALHPEGLQKAVIEHDAFAGFAFDGDGDRVIAVNGKGELKDGDDILALLLTHPAWKNEHGAVSTIMANQSLEQLVTSQGKQFFRTNVGDKYVLEAMVQHNLALGAEPSGHIIIRDIIPTGDGILVALKVLETLILTGNELMATPPKFPQITINVPIKRKRDLQESPLLEIIKASTSHLNQLTTGRLLVRYSGTEPLIRVMVEAADQEHMKAIAQDLAHKLQQELG